MKATKIIITDHFWKGYRDLVKDKMIPYQWRVLNDEQKVDIARENANSLDVVEKSHSIENFRITAKIHDGHHYGFIFQDSDTYKWLEAVAFSLIYAPDAALEKKADDLIALIGQAQDSDGYLDTYFQLEAPDQKFSRVSQSHELYCMGHYIEAGVAYYEATGNQQALDIAQKMANCIDQTFGADEGKIHGYPGHPEIEPALGKLAAVTNESKYADLASYFIHQRGQKPNFFEEQAKTANAKNTGNDGLLFANDAPLNYYQADVPVLDLDKAEGHAVRMVYLLEGMAHIAKLTADEPLLASCKHLWKNIIQQQMYITGGVGSTVAGEAFTFDYDLPNDTMYCETCASVAMVFFAHRMLENEANSEYADIMEKELYNGTLSGMALDGEHFFYVNPLEVDPKSSKLDPTKSHVKVTRPSWFGCACCPPNLARLIASVDQYIYTTSNDTIFVNQFIANHTDFDNGTKITIEGNFPWDNQLKLHIATTNATNLAIRIPSWSKDKFQLSTSDNTSESDYSIENGYMYLPVNANTTIKLELTLDMSIKEIHANPLVKADLNKVCIQRGPIIYCLEEADNGNRLNLISIPKDSKYIALANQKITNKSLVTIQTKGQKQTTTDSLLYPSQLIAKTELVELTFIPYFAWANRQPGEMTVWIHKD